jgi:predicted Rossmann fold flavoprotein
MRGTALSRSGRARTADLAIVGAGAAGLATAIFTARHNRSLQIACLDGATHIGAKILVSGGSRCNVTNRVVTERDFWGGSSRVIRNVLRAFPAVRAAEFFAELGVSLHEEEDGKLFPDSNRSRTVLDALLQEAGQLGIELISGARVEELERTEAGFRLATRAGDVDTRAVVLATGGRSLPKTGSDGAGYGFARALGHGYVETTPALAPLVLDDHARSLSGVSHPAELTVLAAGTRVVLSGPMLWTHFGASGPVVLNASRHWHRARLQGHAVDVLLNLFPGESFDGVDGWLQQQAVERPRAAVSTVLATRVPAAVADAWVAGAGADVAMAHLPREARRTLVHALVSTELRVRDSRGYNVAEVTAGGIPLDEIDPASMESRICPGLYLVGEMLDVDGRLGGFNFQWAWSSAWVAARALAKSLPR